MGKLPVSVGMWMRIYLVRYRNAREKSIASQKERCRPSPIRLKPSPVTNRESSQQDREGTMTQSKQPHRSLDGDGRAPPSEQARQAITDACSYFPKHLDSPPIVS